MPKMMLLLYLLNHLNLLCEKSGAGLILVNKGGHGLEILSERFKRKILNFIKNIT